MEKLKSNKRFLLGLCALMVAVAMVSVGVTLAAWTTPAKNETNVITLGSVKIKLIDEYERNDSVSPNVSVDKKVSVTNTGNSPCYVRILVKRSWKQPSGKPAADPDWILYTHQVGGTETDGYNNADWTKGADVTVDSVVYECYYYTSGDGKLAVGATTSTLFDHFKLVDTFDTAVYGNYEGAITVMAQAVQSDNFPKSDITDWSDITFA